MWVMWLLLFGLILIIQLHRNNNDSFWFCFNEQLWLRVVMVFSCILNWVYFELSFLFLPHVIVENRISSIGSIFSSIFSSLGPAGLLSRLSNSCFLSLLHRRQQTLSQITPLCSFSLSNCLPAHVCIILTRKPPCILHSASYCPEKKTLN